VVRASPQTVTFAAARTRSTGKRRTVSSRRSRDAAVDSLSCPLQSRKSHSHSILNSTQSTPKRSFAAIGKVARRAPHSSHSSPRPGWSLLGALSPSAVSVLAVAPHLY
jgi:hypothetical protein